MKLSLSIILSLIAVLISLAGFFWNIYEFVFKNRRRLEFNVDFYRVSILDMTPEPPVVIRKEYLEELDEYHNFFSISFEVVNKSEKEIRIYQPCFNGRFPRPFVDDAEYPLLLQPGGTKKYYYPFKFFGRWNFEEKDPHIILDFLLKRRSYVAVRDTLSKGYRLRTKKVVNFHRRSIEQYYSSNFIQAPDYTDFINEKFSDLKVKYKG